MSLRLYLFLAQGSDLGRHVHSHRKHAVKIDWKFIGLREGGGRLRGYVPKNRKGKPIDHSGVTIAEGYDIGAHGKGEIKKLPIPQKLKQKLLPYAGKRKEKAVIALRQHPLRITPIEDKELNLAVRQEEDTKSHHRLSTLRPRPIYNVASSGANGCGLDALPKWVSVLLQNSNPS